MRKCIWLFGLLVLVSISASAQDFPRAQVFGMYTYSRSYNSNGDTSSGNGGSGEVAIFPAKMWGIVANVGGATNSGYTNSSGVHFNSSSSTVHYLFGPHIRFGSDRFTPFVEALVGGIHRSNVTQNGVITVNAQTSVDITAGGGIDFKVTNHFSVRPIRIDYTYTRFTPPGVQNTQNGLGISAGAGYTW